MRRFRRAAVVIFAGMALLLSLVGAVAGSPVARAATGTAAADLRVQALHFQKTGNTTQRALALSSLTAASAWQGQLWTDFMTSWDTANKGLKIYTATPDGIPAKGHVFVVLGSALTSSGQATTIVVRRLKVALAALAKYPTSTVLLSGGAPKSGRTEAKVMRDWLVAKGVDPARILLETTSSSTVGNANNSMAILANSPQYTAYTLISDASHIRRATILFNAAKVKIQERTGKAWTLAPIANVAYSDSSTASRGPVPAATHTIIASNVASVFGVLAAYNALLGSPPAVPKLTSIQLTPPTTLTYQVGQSLNATGLKVTALFNDGAYSQPVASPTITGFSSAAVAAVPVKVSLTVAGVTKTATFTCQIVKASSKVSLSLSTTTIKRSLTRVVVKATVAASASKVVPTGKLGFYLDGKLLKTVTADAKGVATYKLPTIAKAGSHQIVVKYLGSSTVKASSRTLTVSVK